jgi:hypothetical protein
MIVFFVIPSSHVTVVAMCSRRTTWSYPLAKDYVIHHVSPVLYVSSSSRSSFIIQMITTVSTVADTMRSYSNHAVLIVMRYVEKFFFQLV